MKQKSQKRNLWNQQNFLPCYDEKIYSLDNGIDALAVVYKSWL